MKDNVKKIIETRSKSFKKKDIKSIKIEKIIEQKIEHSNKRLEKNQSKVV